MASPFVCWTCYSGQSTGVLQIREEASPLFDDLLVLARECGHEPRLWSKKDTTSGMVFLGVIPFIIPCIFCADGKGFVWGSGNHFPFPSVNCQYFSVLGLLIERGLRLSSVEY